MTSAALSAISPSGLDLAAILALDSVPVDLANKPDLSKAQLASLLATIERCRTDEKAPAILFTSAYAGEGAAKIATETAALAAAQVGQRVLLLNIGSDFSSLDLLYPSNPPISLEAVVQKRGEGHPPFLQVEKSQLYFALITDVQPHGVAPLSATQMEILFAKLREVFTTIILFCEGGLQDGAVARFAPLCQGSLLVVEAERTRQPVVHQLQDTVTKNGGTVIGTILNKRRYYIPAFIYKLFFGREKA